ncbi:EamA family transporter [Flavobacterium album]|uniref:EamA family transporter n=1 Tax=Flavobacterium album TaxID=2175091 RepID=A0A2S1R237_9FLAO|nr:EamA family transporter [Flavobacterium album]AWH86646.1 EamA family transporter [Flavobacterium album]
MGSSKYYAAGITAFLIWGFFSFGLKPLHAYPSLDILFYRIFFCAPAMSLITLLFRRNTIAETRAIFRQMLPGAKRKLLLLTFGSALLLMANWFIFIYVMNHISVSAASFAYLVCPILTTVFAYFILKEKLTPLQWAAVGLSVAGCVLLSYNNFMTILYSLVVAATYALYLIMQKKITGVDKFLLLNVQLIIIVLLLLPFYPSYGGPVPQAASFYGYIGIIAVIFTIIPLFLNLYALKGISSSSVGILLYINPIIGFLLSAFYYNEEITVYQIAAYSLILVSIVVFNVRFARPATT